MEDMQELATKIRKDSVAMWEWREKLPENKRPTTLERVQDLHRGILTFIEKNNHYQRTMDTLRHEQNAKHDGRGDDIVRPAWEAKTGAKQFPWSFDTNMRELIKIFHYCFVPIIESLKKDLTTVSRKIDSGLFSIPSKKQIKSIHTEMSQIMIMFQWLQEHWRVHYLGQIDSSGKEDQRFEEVPPGVPDMMKDFEKHIAALSEKLSKLEEKWRGNEANYISWRALWVSGASLLIALGSLVVSIWVAGGGKL